VLKEQQAEAMMGQEKVSFLSRAGIKYQVASGSNS